jgi:hypothetical protein
MRTLLIGGALGALVIALSGCGSSNATSGEAKAAERRVDLYEISQLERSFHEAISKKDIDQLVSLFAPHATGTFGPGKTVSGQEQIRQVWLKSKAFSLRRIGCRIIPHTSSRSPSTETAARSTSNVTSSTSRPRRLRRSPLAISMSQELTAAGGSRTLLEVRQS